MPDERDYYPSWPGPDEYQPALSLSQIDLFDTCRRKWLNQYRYKTLLPPATKRDLEIEKNLVESSVELIAGHVVHAAIGQALRQYQRGKQLPASMPEFGANEIFPEFESYSQQYADELLRDGLAYATPHAYAQPLERIVFGGTFTGLERGAIIEKVRTCLENLSSSTFWTKLLSMSVQSIQFPPEGWHDGKNGRREKIAFPWFWAGHVPFYASYDLLIYLRDKTIIVDWKTGKRNPTKAEIQLNIYAGFVATIPERAGKEIEMRVVWLSEKPDDVSPFKPDPSFMDRWIPLWERRHQDICDLRDRATNDKANIDTHFPITPYVEKCCECRFHSCDGAKRVTEDMRHAVSGSSDQEYEE